MEIARAHLPLIGVRPGGGGTCTLLKVFCGAQCVERESKGDTLPEADPQRARHPPCSRDVPAGENGASCNCRGNLRPGIDKAEPGDPPATA